MTCLFDNLTFYNIFKTKQYNECDTVNLLLYPEFSYGDMNFILVTRYLFLTQMRVIVLGKKHVLLSDNPIYWLISMSLFSLFFILPELFSHYDVIGQTAIVSHPDWSNQNLSVNFTVRCLVGGRLDSMASQTHAPNNCCSCQLGACQAYPDI